MSPTAVRLIDRISLVLTCAAAQAYYLSRFLYIWVVATLPDATIFYHTSSSKTTYTASSW